MKGRLIAALASLMLLAASLSATSITSAMAAPEVIKVAVLNEDTKPSYFEGGLHNKYEDMVNALNGMGFQAQALTSDDIKAGGLTGFHVLVLIDNCPADDAVAAVKSFWEGGGGLVVFDSGVCFLCYAGILPAASAGDDGIGTYWSYSVIDGMQIEIVASHPVTSGYSVGSRIIAEQLGMSDAGYHEDALDDEPEWSHITVLARYVPDPNVIPLLAYEPPGKGRVVFIWCDDVTAGYLATIVKNAVSWASSVSIGPGPGPSPGAGDFFTSPLLWLFVILAVVVIIVIVVALVLVRRKPAPTPTYYAPPPPPPPPPPS